MSTIERTLTYMLRNSGEVLREVEHVDVRLSRRDGPDVLLVTAEREQAVRDGLSLAARVLEEMLDGAELQAAALASVRQSVPWVSWLSEDDQLEFLESFVRVVDACRDTDGHEPLAKLLNRWRASAQIAHDPELEALLDADRGPDEPIRVTRPGARV